MNSSKVDRVSFLDTFRFVAVTFALLAHVRTHYGLDEYQTDFGLLFTFLTRAATPSLLILFGIMLEIIYAPRFAEKPALVASRMLYRSALCYIAFAASAFIAFVAGKKDLEGFIGAASLLTTVPYTLIFKLYFFLLLLGIGIVAARVKHGITSLLLLVSLIWLADLLYVDASNPWPPPFRNLGGVLFGLGSTFGPSVMHSVTLVVFGMMLGSVTFARSLSRSARAMIVLMLIMAAAALLWEIRSNGLRQVLIGIADHRIFRSSNDLVYYAYGAWAAVALMGLAYALHLASPAWLRRLSNKLGSETFAYFFIGNAILLATSSFQVDGVLNIAVLFAGYLLVFCGATLLWLRCTRGSLLLSRAEAWGQARAQALVMGVHITDAELPAGAAQRGTKSEPQGATDPASK